jgi:acetyltransferase-like isoleucine patch superfamily enzyme
MNPLILARRILTPGWVVSLVGLWKWRAKISPRAEVELAGDLDLGSRATIGSFTKLKVTPGRVRFGDRCGIGTGCFIAAGPGGLELGDNVIIGPGVSLVAINYQYERPDVPLEDQGYTSKGIRIGSNVWIGTNSVILDGSSIGDNSIVVAGSVVNRRFPPGCIIQGNPAKILLRRKLQSSDTTGDNQ